MRISCRERAIGEIESGSRKRIAWVRIGDGEVENQRLGETEAIVLRARTQTERVLEYP